ncbi:hypothetical protein FHX08_003958 [Rhizobium sp. BK529]|nr:hypothetical protein [Rhizobium sp. BK529]TCS03343.1 hypothetical protein EV281_104426 [Rhizobium sp. BK418]
MGEAGPAGNRPDLYLLNWRSPNQKLVMKNPEILSRGLQYSN